MKSNKQKMVLIIFVAMSLFAVTNSITYIIQSSNPDMGNLIRSVVFAVVLYGWALVRLLSAKRFAVAFMDFTNVVYAVGFISNIAIAITKLSGVSVLVIVILSIIGIVVNIAASVIARKLQVQTQTLAG